jgi:Tfp pilus assembly protein PilV
MKHSFAPGQSLVELLVALFVIIVGLTAVTNIIFSNARVQSDSADRVVAANLAREAVELAKAVRDSNWVAGGSTAFDTGLADGTDYTGVPRMDGGVFIDFDFAPNALTDDEATLWQSTNPASPGLFVQGTGASGSTTLFRRLVTFAPICDDGSILTSGDACTGGNPKIGMRVTAITQWTNRTGTHQSIVEDDLYDWR